MKFRTILKKLKRFNFLVALKNQETRKRRPRRSRITLQVMMEKSIARNLTKKIYHSLTPKSTSLSSLKMIQCSFLKQCKIGVRSYSKMIIHHSHSYTESSSKWRKALPFLPESLERMSMLNVIKALPLILIISFKNFR